MITACIGRRELGKSTLALYMARQVAGPRVIFDPRAQFAITENAGVDETALFAALDSGAEIAIQPRDLKSDLADTAGIIQEWLDEDRRRKLAVLIDEVGLLDLTPFDFLFRCSQRKLVHFILTFHRPIDLSTDLRAITDRACLFRMTMPHDLDAVENLCGADVRARVERLGEFEFIVFDFNRGIVTRELRQSDKLSWYVPLRASTMAAP